MRRRPPLFDLKATHSPATLFPVRRRSKIFLLAACALIAIVAACFFSLRDNDEPSYHGRTLSQWLEHCPLVDGIPPESDEEQQAVAAVRAIGSNAVPTLLLWRHATNSLRKDWIDKQITNLPDWLRHSSIVEKIYATGARQKHYLALGAFHILRTNALPHLPELMREFKSATTPNDISEAVDAVRCLDGFGVEPLVSFASSTNDYAHYSAAILALVEMSRGIPNAAAAIPTLFSAVQKPDERTSSAALVGLANLLPPDQFLPILTNRLTSTNAWARYDAVHAFRGYTNYVRSALPLLKTRLADPDIEVRESTTNLLAECVPEMFTNASQIRRTARFGLRVPR